MLGRIAARAVTGPAAFLLGGVIDVLAYATASARARWGQVREMGRGAAREAGRGTDRRPARG